jgi:alkanesulfonate monooxygenase SsuD/methylene tetrahydromethanopterin reductase-like flavin-dependent oxidoreductase (luciferase family)
LGDPALGLVVRPEHPPEALPGLARAVEDAGFDELWLWEDCFFAGGIATTATALAATSRVKVGLGIMPAPVRNAAFVAMEIAALARMHPEQVPPVFTGVRRTRSLALSGRVADGTILSEPSSLSYIQWAREQIAATRPHRLTVFAWCNVDADGSAARAALRPLVEERLRDGGPQAEHLGDTADLDALVGRAGVVGTPEECAATIRALGEAGAAAVVLVPQPAHDVDVRAFGELLVLARAA